MNRWLDSRMAGSTRMMESWLVRLIMASHAHVTLVIEDWLDGCMVL